MCHKSYPGIALPEVFLKAQGNLAEGLRGLSRAESMRVVCQNRWACLSRNDGTHKKTQNGREDSSLHNYLPRFGKQ